MRDKDGFLIKCKHSNWEIYNERDDEDDICHTIYGIRHCYADEKCKYYEPEIKDDKVHNLHSAV